MGHGAVTAAENAVPRTRLDATNAAKVATTLQALATPSRLLILARLREGPLAATDLAAEVGMEQSACSHQLRLLRNLGLVVGTRKGRSVIYALYDNHVAELLDQAIHHVEHLRLGMTDTPAEAVEPLSTMAAAPADAL
ncbi:MULTISPECIES: metalloregulator ArsR/SmtB family transcription factor [unclassified Pseudofrankia]|uniref:ArsR/SmtB family transcription factor n=1 Tax=unclassified Pseudofrankia TaxID=2994372 RepID=UPI0008DAEC5F|nr:metalloregulator ArsR/SmtB family transcription factor [Pseudofrankia sp. BMG5.36]MDT3442597.1 metalloregulator ArsR/SmtB family transcription factor [Pseudofrankia sp. BMG5.37]OHV71791.1 transcriptional regulator [Pseudofrankia sp. BMG5.36]